MQNMADARIGANMADLPDHIARDFAIAIFRRPRRPAGGEGADATFVDRNVHVVPHPTHSTRSLLGQFVFRSMLCVVVSSCGLADRPFLRTRKELLRGALASGGAAFASRSAGAAGLPWEAPQRDVTANPLQARFLEKVRILLQDEADATQYGGELAPGGPPVGLPYLSLVPIVQMQNVLVRSRDIVTNRKEWPALIKLLSTGAFETIEFKRIFNQFSDNIYYSSDTTEANAYLLGGATPSSSQTQQYLLRNEALKQVSELVDELKFLSTASEAQLQKLTPEEAQGAAAVEYIDKASSSR